MPPSSETSNPIGIRLLVLALAERRHALVEADPPAALDAARAAPADDESALVAWATAHPARPAIETHLGLLRTLAGVTVCTLVVAALLAGYGSAAAALASGPDGLVNVLAVLGVLLIVPTLTLLAWIVMAALLPRAAGRLSLGGIVDWAVPRLHGLIAHATGSASEATIERTAALDAMRRRELSAPVARWSLGVVTHAAWLAFAIGALVGLLITFSLRERQFCWESTILSAAQWESTVAAVGWLPARLGAPVPTPDQIAASRFSPAQPEAFQPQDDATRRAWASLLFAALIGYAIVPRSLLMGLCVWRRRAARCAWMLPVDRPPLAPLLRTLRSDHERGDRRTAQMATEGISPPAPLRDDADEATGPPAIVGIEIAAPASGWPPPSAADVRDMGIVDVSRHAREDLVRRLAAPPRPERLVVIVAMTAVPDRGVVSMLREVVASARCPARLVLTAGEALRRRGDATAVARRSDEWHRAAQRLGIAAADITEIDLDAMTARTGASLRSFLHGTSSAASVPSRRLESALRYIGDAAASWCSAAVGDGPSAEERLALSREIAALHGDSGMTDRLPIGEISLIQLRQEPLQTLRDAATRVERLLPASLRLRPRWIAVGGLAGALACVGVALAAGPVGAGAALLASPYLAGIGAAAAQLLAGRGAVAATDGADRPTVGGRGEAIGDAVAAATLHALLLELQGLPESQITAVLEATLDRDDPPQLTDAAEALRWLDQVRHRFDLARAAEARR